MVATGIHTVGIWSGTTALENSLVSSQQVKHITDSISIQRSVHESS